MKQIYIANVLEAYYKSYRKLNSKDRIYWTQYDALDGNRSLLYGGDEKIIVSTTPINRQHWEYTCGLAGWKNTLNLVPEEKTTSICSNILTDNSLNTQFIKAVKTNPGIEIIPYRHTEEFYALTEYLHAQDLKFQLPETLPQEHRFIETYFHSKRGFRHLWEMVKDPKLSIEIPEGFITADREEALEAAYYFRVTNRDFLFKYSRGVQGVGIIFNEADKLPADKETFIEKTGELLKDDIWSEGCIVVEEKIHADTAVMGGSPNVEMMITPEGEVKQSYACEQVLDRDGKTFMGVRINPDVYESEYIKTAFRAAKNFGRKLSEYGVRGVFDMDLVVSKDGRVYAVESNIRRTGGTHIHEYCMALFGINYMQKYYIKSYELKVGAKNGKNLEYNGAREILKGLLASRADKSGIYFVNPDFLEMDFLVLMLVSKDKKGLRRLESEVKKRFERGNYG